MYFKKTIKDLSQSRKLNLKFVTLNKKKIHKKMFISACNICKIAQILIVKKKTNTSTKIDAVLDPPKVAIKTYFNLFSSSFSLRRSSAILFISFRA